MDMFVSKETHAEHTPVFTSDGEMNTSEHMLSEQRLRTLRELITRAGAVYTTAEVCQRALEALSSNPSDLLCALLYLLNSDSSQAVLIGASGLTKQTQPELQAIGLSEGTQEFPHASFAHVIQTKQPLLLERPGTEQGSAETAWPDRAMLLPIRVNEVQPIGLLLVGLPPQVAIDEEYRRFLELVALQIASALANARTYEDEYQKMNTFLSLASHELKNPLTSLRGNISLAFRRVSKARQELTSPNAQQQELLDLLSLLLERAERQVLVQNRLVSGLVDTARIQTGKLELHTELIDPNTIVRKAVEEQLQLTPTRIMHVELPADGTCSVVVDAERIKQVIANYLSNALKYSEKEQAISVSLTPLEQEIRVSVRDAGPGLTEEEQGRIWERLYRVPGVEVKNGGGSGLGLGLYVCRSLIEGHQGRVGVESSPGQGSTFWFTLPYAETGADA